MKISKIKIGFNKIVSCTVAVTVLSTCITGTYIARASTALSPDMAILENILYGDRHFVIDTLIGDSDFHSDFSTNPHALVNDIGDEKTMMDNVLRQYRNENDSNYSKAYKVAVDIMEKVYNDDEYVQSVADYVTEFAADIASNFSQNAENVMRDLTYSASQLKYESILKEVLQSDYTASDGTKLSTKETELENLERLDKGLKSLKEFADCFKNYAEANHISDNTFNSRMSYYDKYLIPYTDSVEKALTSFSRFQDTKSTTEKQRLKDMATFVAAMAMISQMDRYEQANEEISSDIVNYAPAFFVSDEALGIIKSGDKAISTVSKTLSAYMFINSIATQKKSVGDTLTRMSKTADPKLKPILLNFADEMGKAGNDKLIMYESLMKYIRDAGVVKELGGKTLSSAASKIQTKLNNSYAFSNVGLASTAITKALASATTIINISSWCVDKTTNFGDTCKKTYELKYLSNLIELAIITYNDDLNTYLSDKTEENAGIVLDDLLMIQKLRLRGEKIAHDITQGQFNSIIGRLLASGTLDPDSMTINYLDTAYQVRVDAFIGASAIPYSLQELVV